MYYVEYGELVEKCLAHLLEGKSMDKDSVNKLLAEQGRDVGKLIRIGYANEIKPFCLSALVGEKYLQLKGKGIFVFDTAGAFRPSGTPLIGEALRKELFQ